MKFVTYRRLSVEDKTKNQHGFDSQLADINHYLESVEGSEVIGDFHEFVSGGADIKPELEKALELCKETGATLLIAKLDRYSRKLVDIAILVESSINLKVALMPNASTFELHIYASLAQQERAMIRDRVTRGLAAAKAKGVLLGGANPKQRESFKANRENHASHRNNVEARAKLQPVVSEIKKMIDFSNNTLTLDSMAGKLNANGYTTNRGNSWSKSSVSRLVKDFGIQRSKLNKHVTV